MSIPLDDVRLALAKNDWVRDVVLERRLPSSIYISIGEREPIAILQQDKKLYLVDSDAHIIPSRNIEKFSDLVQIVGSDAHLHASTLISDLEKDQVLWEEILYAVRYGERRWNLIFNGGITVKMPENNFEKAYSYLSKLNKSGKFFDKGYKMIDLRDEDKYYFEKNQESKK